MKNDIVEYIAQKICEGLRGFVGDQIVEQFETLEVGDVVTTSKWAIFTPDGQCEHQGEIKMTICPSYTMMLLLELDGTLARTMLLEDGTTGWINLEKLAVYE